MIGCKATRSTSSNADSGGKRVNTHSRTVSVMPSTMTMAKHKFERTEVENDNKNRLLWLYNILRHFISAVIFY